jgi:hypothetical protein
MYRLETAAEAAPKPVARWLWLAAVGRWLRRNWPLIASCALVALFLLGRILLPDADEIFP